MESISYESWDHEERYYLQETEDRGLRNHYSK